MAACRRVSIGSYRTQLDKSGGTVYLHRLDGPHTSPVGPSSNAAATPRADADTLHKAYSALLAKLDLSPAHRDDLRSRGLDDAEIDKRQYRTMPKEGRARIARELHRRFGNGVFGVPGFVVKEGNGRKYLTIAAAAGLVVPVRDEKGRIVALKVRRDGATENKYVYVSSKKYGGPGPGAPAHVPLGIASPTPVCRVTEGELKADAATKLSGVPTISAAGVGNWNACIPILKNFQVQTVRLAFDQDACTNEHVRSALKNAAEKLRKEGFVVELERWDGTVAKGIDDALKAGLSIEVVTGDEVFASLRPDAEPATAKSPSAAPTTQADQVHEAEDDPHRLARIYRDRHLGDEGLRLRYWRSEWYRWDGTAYRPFSDKEIRAELSECIKEEFDRINLLAVKLWKSDPTDEDRGPCPNARKVTARLVTDVAHALAGMVLIPDNVQPPTWLEAADYPPPFQADQVLACRNALVDLPSFVGGRPDYRCKPTPRFFSLNALDYDFDANAPKPDNWTGFLNKVWSDDQAAIDTLQEWFGYSLTPDTRQQKIMSIVGPKRSGKGTIARVLRGVVGIENTAGPTLASLGTNFGLAPLLSKSLAIISDARLSGRTDAAMVVERLLSISGEDAQTIDRKHMAHVTVKLPVRFVILTNELPRLNDQSGALVGRLILLRQTLSWFGKEDMTLTDQLLKELPGILLWSIEGWKRLQARGYFVQPKSGLELVGEMEDLSSPVGAFVRECCEVGPGYEAQVAALFQQWNAWCERKGRKEPGTEQVFGRDLRAAVPGIDTKQPRKDGERFRIYVGLRIRPEVEGIPDY
jgi:putative DNA primase/helicase